MTVPTHDAAMSRGSCTGGFAVVMRSPDLRPVAVSHYSDDADRTVDVDPRAKPRRQRPKLLENAPRVVGRREMWQPAPTHIVRVAEVQRIQPDLLQPVAVEHR